MRLAVTHTRATHHAWVYITGDGTFPKSLSARRPQCFPIKFFIVTKFSLTHAVELWSSKWGSQATPLA